MRLAVLRFALRLVHFVERHPRASIAIVAMTAATCVLWPSGREELALATFNIENYPRSDHQADRAFELVGDLDIDALAVQEIREPAHFEARARARLGPSWRFVHALGEHPQKVGVLFDRDELELLATETHRETMVGGRAKPAFEARFMRASDGSLLRFFVLHLASGSENVERRRQQLLAIEPVLRRAADSGERIAVAGDFNATSEEDRLVIEALSRRLGLAWASRALPCTSYWRRRDGCVGSALDHVMVSGEVERIEALGGCLTYGCDRRAECPPYRDAVSDHCPVRFVLP